MSTRIVRNVARPEPVEITVNGAPVQAHEGESLATALIASGALRHLYCNMGVCFDCLVVVEGEGARTVRACMTSVRAGLRISVPDR